MKSCIIVLNVFVMMSLTSSVYAQTTLDLKKYDENGFIRNQPNRPVVSTGTTAPIDITKKIPTDTTSAPVPTPIKVINLEAFKQGEPASCFDYYTFGSIAVNLSTDTSSYTPGDPVLLRGQITNNNTYPLTNLTIKARMVKDIPNPDYSRSEIITLDDVDIIKDITLKAGESFDVNYSHLLPLNAPKGNYQIFFYAYNNDRFNQSGLSFTNDIVASRLNFTVTGNNPQYIYLDQTKITLNDQPHNVMAFMTNHKKDTPITISIPLVNPSSTAEDMTVTYTLYKWDGLRKENIVDTKTETISVPAKGKKILTYTTTKTDTSVYFLTIRADITTQTKDKSIANTQTASNIRFTVDGYDFPRINSFGVNTYPIKANTEAILFTCYHNGASQETLNAMNIKTILYDDTGKEITKTEYDGKITGAISAIIKKFTLKKDLVNFKTITTLTDSNGTVIDTIENNYNCKDLDPTLCPKPTIIPGIFSTKDIPWTYILFGLAVLIILFMIMKKRRHSNQSNTISSIFLLGLILVSSCAFVGKAEAAVVSSPFNMEFSYFNLEDSAYLLGVGERPIYPGFLAFTGQIRDDYNRLNNTMFVGGAEGKMTGEFQKEFNLVKSGVNLSDIEENVVNKNDVFVVSTTPTTGGWLIEGDENDSPPMDGVLYKGGSWAPLSSTNKVTGGVQTMNSVSTPIETGTINISSNNPDVVSCTNTECTAKNAGTAVITVSFSNEELHSPYSYTCDMFTYYNSYSGKNQEGLGGCTAGIHSSSGYPIPSISNGSLPPYQNNAFWHYENTGFGMSNVYMWATVEDGAQDFKSAAFSFPPITYTIKVSGVSNTPQTSSCANITGVSTTGATINWTYSDTNGTVDTSDDDPQTVYAVQLATKSFSDPTFNELNDVAFSASVANSNTSHTFTGLAPNTTYYARVRTYNDSNNWSDYAGCSNFKTPAIILTPSCDVSAILENTQLNRGDGFLEADLRITNDSASGTVFPGNAKLVLQNISADLVYDPPIDFYAFNEDGKMPDGHPYWNLDSAIGTGIAPKNSILITRGVIYYSRARVIFPNPSFLFISDNCTQNPTPITATCSPSSSSVTLGQPITWTANNILGGNGTYTYSWSGTDGLDGTTNPLPKTYTTAGSKNASVLITSGTQTTTVNCTASVTANHTLTINTAGTGGGTTTGAGTYISGTVVTATAIPNASSTFTGWSGACNTSGQVTMDADKTCIATFTTPTTFTITSSSNNECTNSILNSYIIGCTEVNGASPIVCKNKFESLFNGTTALEVITHIAWEKGGVRQSPDLTVTCTRDHPADAAYENITCTVPLPSGETVSIYKGDYGGGDSYQAMTELTTLDQDIPEGTIVNPSAPSNSKEFNSPNWKKDNITVKIQCKNGSVGDVYNRCKCAGVEDGNWGADNFADTTIFTREFGEGLLTEKPFYVYDNAGNPSSSLPPAEVKVSLGIDKTNPVVDVTSWGIFYVTISANDPLSGLPANIQTSSSGDPACIETGQVIKTSGHYDYNKSTTKWVTPGDTLKYCVSDAAGNVTRGQYPGGTVSSYSGCFADGTMSSAPPTLTSYTDPLRIRMNAGRYGYSLSDSTRATQNTTFRTRLNQNINTYIKNLYQADEISSGNSVTINLTNTTTAARLIDSSTRNTNGYFYYKNEANNNTHKFVTVTAGAKLSSPKVLLVEGMDVQIDNNILYESGTNASLVIIASKNNYGVGGNIYINPTVNRIGATLIADGSLMNGEDASQINWIDDADQLTNPLTINGRLSTYNTRGGSLIVNGDTLQDIGTGNGKCFTSTTFNSACPYATAASQDLERFRLTTAPSGQCTLYVLGSNSTIIDVLSSLTY